MINFPRVNLKDNKLLIMVSLLLLMIHICSHLSMNLLISFIFIILFLLHYKKTYKEIKKDLFLEKGTDINYNNRIQDLLLELKKYKDISPYSYNEGKKLWKMFINEIIILENERLYNYVQHFENAQLYLKEATNIFIELGTGTNERKYIDAIEYNDFEDTKDLNHISKISKELYQEGHNILYNISLRLNERWKKDPNIHNKEIIINYTQPLDKNITKYEYFI